ncbi:hypothetical protein MOO45_03480 [Bombilactobacillus folatiphilus]|uniref:Uncharacterized protein n=1 Tax=Bombilactobacillus folatiphilus TaxID=2923362 RepID=A0ABY4PAE8_9LACO|nr:hypothetical protein [Bombilactobacillus folatiphilus]UQS82715.1 hypothetical protein MOO45_03480 [Bombilactobacillus folatiphilus]
METEEKSEMSRLKSSDPAKETEHHVFSRFDPQAKSLRLKRWLNHCLVIVIILIILVYLILFFV